MIFDNVGKMVRTGRFTVQDEFPYLLARIHLPEINVARNVERYVAQRAARNPTSENLTSQSETWNGIGGTELHYTQRVISVSKVWEGKLLGLFLHFLPYMIRYRM